MSPNLEISTMVHSSDCVSSTTGKGLTTEVNCSPQSVSYTYSVPCMYVRSVKNHIPALDSEGVGRLISLNYKGEHLSCFAWHSHYLSLSLTHTHPHTECRCFLRELVLTWSCHLPMASCPLLPVSWRRSNSSVSLSRRRRAGGDHQRTTGMTQSGLLGGGRRMVR